MKKILAGFFLIIGFSFLAGCNNSSNNSKSCYDTEEEAWQACNNKYNGKCKFLGSDYKVCSNPNIVETKSVQPLAYTADCSIKADDDPNDSPSDLKITMDNGILTSPDFTQTLHFQGKSADYFQYCMKCGDEYEIGISVSEVKDGHVRYSAMYSNGDSESGTCTLR